MNANDVNHKEHPSNKGKLANSGVNTVARE